MRSSIARRAAVFGSAALLLLGPVAASAQADPVEPGVSDQAAKLPAELIDAIQRDLSLSPDQYSVTSDRTSMAAPGLLYLAILPAFGTDLLARAVLAS